MTRNRLYVVAVIACFFGTLYFLYHLIYASIQLPSVCLIKNLTGFPCPSCGTTKAVEYLSKGQIVKSINQNPFGLIVGFCMLVIPFWIGYDLIGKKATFYQFYLKTESITRKPKIAIVLILLVILNWIWNLYKHL